jgi:hypothetical protein
MIYQLQDNNKIIEGDTTLKKYITSYYKGLFSPPQDNNFRLDESRKEDIPQVSNEENEQLTQPFTAEEIKNAVFQIEHNKSLGPDGFPAKFYQVFCELIKKDLMDLFYEFHKGKLPIYSLNFGTIILLPKCKEAIRIQ